MGIAIEVTEADKTQTTAIFDGILKEMQVVVETVRVARDRVAAAAPLKSDAYCAEVKEAVRQLGQVFECLGEIDPGRLPISLGIE